MLFVKKNVAEQFIKVTPNKSDFFKCKIEEVGSTNLLSTMRYDPNFAMPIDGQVNIPKQQFSSLDNIQDEVNEWLQIPKYSAFSLPEINTMYKHQFDKKINLNIEADLYDIFYYRFLLLGEQFIRLKVSSFLCNRSFGLTLRDFVDGLVDAIYNVEKVDDLDNNSRGKMIYLLKCTKTYKMRVLLKPDSSLEFQAHALGEFPMKPDYFTKTVLSPILTFSINETKDIWDVFIDSEPIETSIFTSLKTTNRKSYSAARSRMEEIKAKLGMTGKSEILVWNQDRVLMEGTITNVAVLNDSEKFVSPSLRSGCLSGTMRHYLIKKKIIEPGHINVDELYEGQYILLFNGVMGVVMGRIRNTLK